MRKAVREERKKQKEEKKKKDAEKKKKNEEKKKKDEEKKRNIKKKQQAKNRNHQKRIDSSDTDMESDMEMPALKDDDTDISDISFNRIDKKACAYCLTDFTESEEESDTKVVGCEMCPRWAHKSCTKDRTLMELDDVDDIKAYPFSCYKCDV